MNATRVAHLVDLLHDVGVTSGKVLEVGGAFGSFAYALRRLGYDVTVTDRYADFGGGLDPFIDLMAREGVNVVATTRVNEGEMLGALGEFDVVLSMAVIEHIPHTPRPFLEMLRSHVRPEGILAVDTPNIARYWSRRRLNSGCSVYVELEHQFDSSIPFEGHHREYAPDEVRWMLERIGLKDVRVALFDYNLFQFDVISGDHLDALFAMTCDPTFADTILAIGRRSA